MLIFISPIFIAWLVPIAIVVLIILWPFWAVFKALRKRFKKPPEPYQPKTDSPELLEAIRNGYSPAVPIGEIVPYPINRQDIDKIVGVRDYFFPENEYQARFYNTDDLPDLGPDELKGLALRLYLEMAFIRCYILENSPNPWSQRVEELWVYHIPRPLRKLAPDFYRQLLTKLEQATANRHSHKAA